jgi:hypothetical protein
MRKFLYLSIILCFACNGSILSGDKFSGDWVISESSPNYEEIKAQDVLVKIAKEDVFYIVDIIKEGKSMRDEFKSQLSKDTDYKMMESVFKYQLSPDKRFLINITSPSMNIIYNDDNKSIKTVWGWFVKK